MNKKALVVGGSNGLGLALVLKLMNQGYEAVIVDQTAPDSQILPEDASFTFYQNDLRYFDRELFLGLAQDQSIEVLMITAGFGRVMPFEYIHTADIEGLMRVNAEASLKIVSLFYDRIRSQEPFYTGMMGSIAGLISSPSFSVYAASKAAVCRFVESVNIELEVAGSPNRILNVSPGSLKGTRFHGQGNQPELLDGLTDELLKALFARETLLIPDYEETYKGVMERYQNDAHAFGLQSYQYKLDAGRLIMEPKVCIGYLSGTFDLFHVGHLNLLRRAKAQCDFLIVGVHASGSWKKKETFIPFEERCEIIAACRYVDKVVESPVEDSDAWELYHYNKLFVGDDYKGTERFAKYEKYLGEHGVEIVYFPYTKSTSSTQIRAKIRNAAE